MHTGQHQVTCPFGAQSQDMTSSLAGSLVPRPWAGSSGPSSQMRSYTSQNRCFCLQAALLSGMGATPSSCISLMHVETLPTVSFSGRFTYLLCPWLAHAF